jgi:GNAT superfamily N-acetyltransferase
MNINIREIRSDEAEINAAKGFLFDQIDKEYHIGPTPKFHYDIFDLEDYYIKPSRSNFFVAIDDGKIVATAAIRPYDKDYEYFKGIYSQDDTASIWRLMVDKEYRRNGLARILVGLMEDFARNEGYDKIYLHSHRYLDAAIPFWKSLDYEVTLEEDDYDETTHMVKYL